MCSISQWNIFSWITVKVWIYHEDLVFDIITYLLGKGSTGFRLFVSIYVLGVDWKIIICHMNMTSFKWMF